MAKEFLKQNKIDYIEYNISKDPKVMKTLMTMGYMSVPLIIIEEEIIIGFDKGKIEKIIIS